MSSFIDRYQQGECEQVWAELQALGERVREEPLFPDAMAVAHETMRRVRHNLELLVPRLSELGYRFGYMSLPGIRDLQHPQVLALPVSDVKEKVAELERQCGILPLSLRAFYEVVGEVNLVGEPPKAWHDWLSVPDDIDALYVDPIDVALRTIEPWAKVYGSVDPEEWDLPGPDEEDLCDSRAYFALPRDCWLVPLAPDEWHKYDISGCGGYDIAVPHLAADARLLTEGHRTTFVNYLRICLRWGGFPKLERLATDPNQVSGLATLTRDLLPI
jgi:hypothetical protein